MKIITSFRVFESGLPGGVTRATQGAIEGLLSESRFLPHIDEENEWIGGKRRFNIGVAANALKVGTQWKVFFRLDREVDLRLVNPEIQSCWRDIMEIIMDQSGGSTRIKLTAFNWFGHSLTGLRGPTGEPEDLTEELIEAIELGEAGPNPLPYQPIMFQFSVR